MPLPDNIYMNRHRFRSNLVRGGTAQKYFLDAPSGAPQELMLNPKEETWDRDNAWFAFQDHLKSVKKTDREYWNRLRTLDVGSPFSNEKQSVELGQQYFQLNHATPSHPRYYGYDGPLVAKIVTDSAMNAGPFANPYQASILTTLDRLGATAIARCAPTAPHASVYTAIGELKNDGLPAVPGLTSWRDRNPSALGSEYLNYTFGIAPTISDIRQIYKATKDAHRILAQYYRDSGRLVRRSYAFPVEESVVSRDVVSNVYPVGLNGASNTYFWLKTGTLETTVTEKVERWFSGAFMYFAQAPEGLLGNTEALLQKGNVLLGIAPTPSAIWNLQPWSWAADWVTNMGDVLQNISMFLTDGLVMKYGYIMEHKTRTVEYHLQGAIADTLAGPRPVELTQRFVQETKYRRPATPFGFGLELDGFTEKQWAIMAALGISRFGRHS